MQYYMFLIVRFFCYVVVTVLGIVCMIRASDDAVARRIIAVAALGAVMLNQTLSRIVYNLLASALETVTLVAGLGFFLVLLLTLVFLPVILVVAWIKSR